MINSNQNLLFDFDGWVIAAAFLFGVIGMWLFREARRRENNHNKYIAMALMLYPYFIEGRLLNWGVGIALCLAAYHYW